MATFFDLQKSALKRMRLAAELAEKLGCETVAETIREKCGEMLRRELTVVVAGEVKRGKSSLLNALLNETESVCPVDADVCTNAATILRYGEKEQISVYIVDYSENGTQEDLVRVETIARGQLQEYVSEKHNPGNFKNVFRIEAQIPNELLKEGVVFVDTPGVGSLNAEHAETTLCFLPSADLLLFVTDAVTPITYTELEFLKRGYSYCSSVVYPLTKKDLCNDPDVILEGNRRKISETLGIDGDQIQIVPVSSAAKLRYLADPKKRLAYRNSNYARLEETIWTAIAKRQAEVRIQPYLMVAENELRKMIDNLVAQYRVLGENTAAKELADKLGQYQSELEKLQDERADWLDDLNRFFMNKQITMNDKLNNIKVEAQTHLTQQSSAMKVEICEPEKYNQVVGELNDIIIRGGMNIREDLESDLNGKILSLQKEMKLDLNVNQSILDGMKYNPTDDVVVSFPQKSVMDRLKKQGRDINSARFGLVGVGSFMGGAVGGVAGAAVVALALVQTGTIGVPGSGTAIVEGIKYGASGGAALGAAAGTAIAAAGSAFSAVKRVVKGKRYHDESDAALVVKALQTHISKASSGLSTASNLALKNMQQDTISGFRKLLRNREQEIKQHIAEINQSLLLEKNEIPRRKKELKEKVEQLKELLAQVMDLQHSIVDLSGAGSAGREQKAVLPAPAEKQKVVEYGFL